VQQLVVVVDDVKGVVMGVAELQGVIYTVCKDSKSIQSYKLDEFFTNQRDILVDGLQDACDVVACRNKLRLYVADQQGIWVVSPASHRVWLSILLRFYQSTTSVLFSIVNLVNFVCYSFAFSSCCIS